jgi:phage antirepressor YoqD-like protein
MTSTIVQVQDYEIFLKEDAGENLELVVNKTTGQAFASISATARMLGTNESNIRKYLKDNPEEITAIPATIPTPAGNRSSRLIPANDVFNLAFRYNLILAQRMGSIGANLYLLNLAGYSPSILPTHRKPTLLEVSKAFIQAQEKLEELEQQVEEDLPATTLGKLIDKSNQDGLLSIGDFAKALSSKENPLGRRRLFVLLREWGLIQKTLGANTIPYQHQLQAKHFVVTESLSLTNKTYSIAFVTPKGQVYIANRYQQWLDRKNGGGELVAA